MMEYKTLNNKFKIPVLGLGTWGIGGLVESDYSNDKESIISIRSALELGYSHIDTAELYGAGHTEELVGQAINEVGRSELVITSKVWKSNLSYNDLISSCNRSLEKLKTKYIDAYLIHAPNPDIPIEETMAALDYLIEEKYIRSIGVSNFTVEQLKNAQLHSKNKIAAFQIPYNLSARNKNYKGSLVNMESETIPYCQANDILVMAYRPIERGFLLRPNFLLDQLSEKYNKTKAQIALNWLISKKNIITIPKSTNLDHLKENLEAVGWTLSAEDIRLLDETEFESPSK
jgi:diketogulonate reductase-like aldo/keto reductase